MGVASLHPLDFVRSCCHTVGQGKLTQKLPGFQEPLGGGNDISPRDERRLASATKKRPSSAREKTVTSPRNAAPGPMASTTARVETSPQRTRENSCLPMEKACTIPPLTRTRGRAAIGGPGTFRSL